jgi:hypothetical protein
MRSKSPEARIPKARSRSRTAKLDELEPEPTPEPERKIPVFPAAAQPPIWPTLAENGNPAHQDLHYRFFGLRGFQTADGRLNINGIEVPTNPLECASPYYFIDIDATKVLGAGSYGTTYPACLAGGACDFVGKVIPLDARLNSFPFAAAGRTFNDQNFLLETLLATFMGKKNIGPKVYAAFRCRLLGRPVGVIIMEKLGKNLGRVKLTATGWSNLWSKIQALHAEGVIHNDLYRRNIMTTVNSDEEFRIIDYGLALILAQPNTGKILKAAETLDFFVGEARLAYTHPPEFEDADTKAMAWEQDICGNVSFTEFREAMRLVTFGWPEDDPRLTLVEDTYTDWSVVHEALEAGLPITTSGLPHRGDFYVETFRLLLPAQRQLLYLNKYALHMTPRVEDIYVDRPFVSFAQREEVVDYLVRSKTLGNRDYLKRYFRV